MLQIGAMIAELSGPAQDQNAPKISICFDEFLNLMADPSRSLAQSFANRMETLNQNAVSNISLLKLWREMASSLNNGMCASVCVCVCTCA